ncbi:MAG: hypothetical protein L0G46_08570 [Kocuria sp.]|nr:hypothetical protein [Kocuria sp.]
MVERFRVGALENGESRRPHPGRQRTGGPTLGVLDVLPHGAQRGDVVQELLGPPQQRPTFPTSQLSHPSPHPDCAQNMARGG